MGFLNFYGQWLFVATPYWAIMSLVFLVALGLAAGIGHGELMRSQRSPYWPFRKIRDADYTPIRPLNPNR